VPATQLEDARMDSVPSYKGVEPGPIWLEPAELSPDGTARWIITRHDDVTAALSDPRLRMQGSLPNQSANCAFTGLVDRGKSSSTGLTATEILFGTFFVFDPPVHNRLRKLVARYFTAQRLELMRPRVQQIADELLDQIQDREQVDLIKTFAFPLPVRVLSELLDVPEHIAKRFIPPEEERTNPVIPLDVAHPAALELAEFRRTEPGDDMVSALAIAYEKGEISREELYALPLIMMVAGYLTTVHLIGNAVTTLLRSPDQLAALRHDPALLPSAVDEVLRYVGSVYSVSRYAREEVEIGGTTIPAGSQVRIYMGAANRDPSKFSDPDGVDIRRGGHGLAFGHGLNYCLGSYLAKVEGEVAIGSLLRRFPDLALAEPVTIREIEDGVIGLNRLPVRLHAPARVG
jgi:cytochrome P450